MTTLRRVLILPFLVGVFSLLSLSVGKSQVKYVTTTTNGNLTVTKTVEMDSLNSAVIATTIDSSFSVDTANLTATNNINFDLKAGPHSKEEIDKAMNVCSMGLGLAIPELRKLAKNPDINYRKKGLNTVFKSLDVTANGADAGDFAFSDAFATSITSEDFNKSADNFSKIKTNIDALRKEQSSNTKLTGFQKQMLFLMQDGLMTKVLTEVLSETMSTMMGSMENMLGAKDGRGEAMDMAKGLLTNITGSLGSIIGSQPVEQAETATIDNNQNMTDDDILKQAYQLKPEQFKEIGMHFVPYTDIYTIEKNENETKVTLVLGISSAHSWFLINRAAKIIDAASKDEYHLRSVEKNIPLDKMIIAPSGKDKMIAVTLIFPPLKESVKRMDIIAGIFTNEDRPEGIPWDFMGVNPDQYLIKESPKIYK